MAGNASNWIKPKFGGFKNQKLYVRKETLVALGYATPNDIRKELEAGGGYGKGNAKERYRISEALGDQKPLTGKAIRKDEVGILSGNTPSGLKTKNADLRFDRNKPVDTTIPVNGIALKPVPENSYDTHKDVKLSEPPLPNDPKKRLATGVIVVEPDGRVWMVAPAGSYSGYRNTFPAGGAEDGITLQQNARKEAREEMGLDVKIIGHAADIDYGYELRRFYVAQRVSGQPGDNGWETADVKLVTPGRAAKLLSKASDVALLQSVITRAGLGPNRPGPVIYAEPNGKVIPKPAPAPKPAAGAAPAGQRAAPPAVAALVGKPAPKSATTVTKVRGASVIQLSGGGYAATDATGAVVSVHRSQQGATTAMQTISANAAAKKKP